MNINLGLKRHTFWYLITSNFLLIFGFRIWQTMINNFAVEEIGIGPAAIGLMQALREVPGLQGFLVGFVALFLSEVRIMALSATDLPDPVVPATSRCGIFVRFATMGRPEMLLPSDRVKGWFDFS